MEIKMKNIFIGGVARSWKGTLASLIKQNVPQYNHISLDYFTSALKEIFPETGIKTDVIMGETSPKLARLLSKVMDIINTKEEKYIIDSAHILPYDILKYIDAKKWDVYFLGYPNTTVEEKTKVILEKDDKNDWTKKKTFDELCFKIKNLIEISKTIEAECKKNNIRFVNTSINFDKQLRAISDLYK